MTSSGHPLSVMTVSSSGWNFNIYSLWHGYSTKIQISPIKDVTVITIQRTERMVQALIRKINRIDHPPEYAAKKVLFVSVIAFR